MMTGISTMAATSDAIDGVIISINFTHLFIKKKVVIRICLESKSPPKQRAFCGGVAGCAGQGRGMGWLLGRCNCAPTGTQAVDLIDYTSNGVLLTLQGEELGRDDGGSLYPFFFIDILRFFAAHVDNL